LIKLAAFALIMILTVPALACQPSTQVKTGGKPIVVTYSILGAVVKDLVGDKAEVIISVPNGLDPHDWEPSAKAIEVINKASLVIRNGLGLEGGLEKSLSTAEIQGVRMFTASNHIEIRHVGMGEGIPSGDPDQAIGAADPHLWTDPVVIKSLVGPLAEELKKSLGLDVSARASDLEGRLDSLDRRVAGMIEAIPPQGRKMVTGHESLGYFAQRYGFQLIGMIVPSLSTQAGVSASNLAELNKLIRENQVRVIFSELGTSPDVAETISKETGVRVVELSTHVLPRDGSYFTYMLDLAGVITGALQN
jgi:zinc/manganese transport system substrate-binding protein